MKYQLYDLESEALEFETTSGKAMLQYLYSILDRDEVRKLRQNPSETIKEALAKALETDDGLSYMLKIY